MGKTIINFTKSEINLITKKVAEKIFPLIEQEFKRFSDQVRSLSQEVKEVGDSNIRYTILNNDLFKLNTELKKEIQEHQIRKEVTMENQRLKEEINHWEEVLKKINSLGDKMENENKKILIKQEGVIRKHGTGAYFLSKKDYIGHKAKLVIFKEKLKETKPKE